MAAQTLQDLYIDELADLRSANEQMQQLMPEFAKATTGERLKRLIEQSESGIGKHTETLTQLVASHNRSGTQQCTAMEGLVQEARKHVLQADLPDNLRDVALIAQYQRMSHYGVAAFGTAAAYAEALGLSDDAAKLRAIVSDIYKADEYSSQLAEAAEQSAAKK